MRAPPARPNLRARITHSYRPREKGSSEASRRRPVAHARVRLLHPSIAGNVKAELDLFISKGGLRLIKTDGKILGAFPLQRIQQWGITQPGMFPSFFKETSAFFSAQQGRNVLISSNSSTKRFK